MQLNRIEKALMNNPVRAAIQRWYEARLLERLGGRTDGLRVLEIGCGRGVGTEIIVERFRAREVVAFDLDPDMVSQARARLARYLTARVHLHVGDAAAIAEPDASFDAVFDFGIVHHIPQWRDAVAEVRRVLRPAGRFFFEEVTRQALERWGYRTFLEHPTYDRFSGDAFVAALEQRGISVDGRYVHRFFGDFVIGVGRAA
jgi:ubiquinone/menaquinone biosynthesis C-methylase UbiE